MTEMKSFQEFVKFFTYFKEHQKVPIIRSFPKHIAEKKAEDFADWVSDFRKGMMYKIDLDLRLAKIFEVDKRTKRAMLMTKMPSDKNVLKMIRLKFPVMFLDVELDTNDADLGRGKNLIIHGIIVSEQVVKQNDVLFNVFYPIKDYTDGKIYFEHMKISFTDCAEQIEYAKGLSKTKKVVQQLIVNTILFLNTPEVETVVRLRSEKNQKRRARQGKMPLPESRVIKLTGTIKRYFDLHGDSYDRDGYSHQFDVAGTWRHFRSDKFKRIHKMKSNQLEKEGYVVDEGVPAKWIPPFKKGTGVYIKKSYSVEKDKEEGEMDLEDVKPLTKPLSSMSTKQREAHKRKHTKGETNGN